MPPTLSDIPAEMLLAIMDFLDAKTLVSSSAVCTLWNEIITTSPGLRYTIELWADGMVRGPSGTLTHAGALEKLLGRRRAWRNLEWKSRATVQIESLHFCRAYELVGGVFAQQETGPDFVILSLPQIVEEPDHARSTHSFGVEPLDFQDFAIDPTQDLLVIVHVSTDNVAHIECRTLSAQQVHPLAALPMLEFPHVSDPAMVLSIGIAADIVGLFFPRLEPAKRILLNWRLGVIIDTTVQPLSFASGDFHLLTPRAYILTRAEENGQPNSGQIQIFTFRGDAPNAPTHVASLALPETAPGGYITSMGMQMGPFCAHPNPHAPFSKANGSRICMFLILYNFDDWVRLFVHCRWLERYTTLASTSGEDTELPVVVPWAEWGPLNSRMLPGDDHRWIRHVHGERVALPREDKHSVLVLDFGVIPRRGDPTPTWHFDFHDTELVLGSSTMLDEDEIFEQRVTTCLPYRWTLRAVEKQHTLFLLDEDCVIGMDLEDDTTVRHEMTIYTL
ncbi:hypothetical protein C8R46DRAFT_1184927 [Mycena filopes]|nr:hypothetical protein C8R46DRAFT_1184927 [Mycena filopes]